MRAFEQIRGRRALPGFLLRLGKGRKALSGERAFLPPPNLLSPSPKTFDRWGGPGRGHGNQAYATRRLSAKCLLSANRSCPIQNNRVPFPKALLCMWLFHLHSAVKNTAFFPVFHLVESTVKAFFRLSLWSFKEKSINHFLGHSLFNSSLMDFVVGGILLVIPLEFQEIRH